MLSVKEANKQKYLKHLKYITKENSIPINYYKYRYVPKFFILSMVNGDIQPDAFRKYKRCNDKSEQHNPLTCLRCVKLNYFNRRFTRNINKPAECWEFCHDCEEPKYKAKEKPYICLDELEYSDFVYNDEEDYINIQGYNVELEVVENVSLADYM
jgi:hypothetical protein